MKKFLLCSILMFECLKCFAGLEEGRSFFLKEDYSAALNEFLPLAEQGDVDAQLQLAWLYYTSPDSLKVKNYAAEALKWYGRAAEQGNAKAQFFVGRIYHAGGVLGKYSDNCDIDTVIYPERVLPEEYNKNQNDIQAEEWLLKSAQQNNTDAQCLLGLLYFNGLGVDKDISKAVDFLTKAADQNDLTAQYELGKLYYEFGENGQTYKYQQAANWYLKAASQGHIRSQCNLGIMFLKGEGVPQSFEQALLWFNKAAEKGDLWAELEIADMYYKGKSVPQNHLRAASLYRKIIQTGSSFPLVRLAFMYEKGLGVTKNLVLAHMLYNLEAAIGNSSKDRERVAAQLTSEQLSEAQELAIKWKSGMPLPTKTKTYPINRKKKNVRM